MSDIASESKSSPKKSPTKKEIDTVTLALNNLAQGKRHLLVNDIPSAVNSLQEACRLLAEHYGETAPECADAYFYYGRALLEMARIETGVIGNALDGVPEEDDLENSQVENPENMTDQERDLVSEQVEDALEENFNLLEQQKEESKANGKESDASGKEKANAGKKENATPNKVESEADKDSKTDKTETKKEDSDISESKEEKKDISKSDSTKEEKKDISKSDSTKEEKKDISKSDSTKEEKVTSKSDSAKEEKVTSKSDSVKEEKVASKSDSVKEEKVASKSDSAKEDSAKPDVEKEKESSNDKKSEQKFVEDKDTETKDKIKTNGVSKEEESMEVDSEQKESEESQDEEKEASDAEEDDSQPEEEENGETAEEGAEPSPEGEKTEEEEDISNLQLSWEMLELAKHIFQKQSDKAEVDLKIAQVYLKLGEVSVEDEKYAQGIEDFNNCLNIQMKELPSDDRCIAETHYQLGIAHSYSDDFDKAIESFKAARNVIETRISNLKKKIEEISSWSEEKKKAEALERKDPFYTEEGEIEELEKLLPEMNEKVTDMEQMKKDSKDRLAKAKEQVFASFIGGASSSSSNNPFGASTSGEQASNEAGSSVQVSNISHLMRKKRKPDEEIEKDEPKKTKVGGEESPSATKSNGTSKQNGSHSSPEKMQTEETEAKSAVSPTKKPVAENANEKSTEQKTSA